MKTTTQNEAKKKFAEKISQLDCAGLSKLFDELKADSEVPLSVLMYVSKEYEIRSKGMTRRRVMK